MATPNDRRIICSTYIVPQIQYTKTGNQEEVEEGFDVGQASYPAYKIDTTVGKTLGGKSTVTIDTNQHHTDGNNGWCSMSHPKLTWDLDEGKWDSDETCWADYLTVDTDGKNLTGEVDDLDFCYIKNIGDNEAQVSLDGTNYYIKLAAGASTYFRGYDTDLAMSDIKVKAYSSTTNIEYIIAY